MKNLRTKLAEILDPCLGRDLFTSQRKAALDAIEALCREVREEALEEAALHLEGKHRRDGMNCETRARIPAEGTTTDVFGSTCGNCSRAEFVRALKGKP